MRGRPRLNPDRRLTNAECQARWRQRHGKPPAPKPEEPPETFQLRTFGELAAAAQQPLERAPFFDPKAMIG
jgi:hypothetical protein